MARIARIDGSRNIDSEMEEGEIVDELDYLSDISSEEEFLLRQRLLVLENYNHVLERKKAKRSLAPGTKHKKAHSPLPDLSEISATDLEENYNISYTVSKPYKHLKTHHKQRRKKDHVVKLNVKEHTITKDGKKKTHRNRKKVPESSDSSDDTGSEYRNKRRKLANAVIVNKDKVDKTSLSARLKNMLGTTQDPKEEKIALIEINQSVTENIAVDETFDKVIDPTLSPISAVNAQDFLISDEIKDKITDKDDVDGLTNKCELIDLCSDDDRTVNTISVNNNGCANIEETGIKVDTESKNDSNNKNNEIKTTKKSISDKDSDDDLELLRQNALQTKTVKAKTAIETENKILSEDEDSDTAELRLICLKSALLKKAIEMKQKQKKQKRLSQSVNLQEDLFNEQEMFPSKINSENNTDIESVDMDIGSDGDDKNKELEKNAEESKEIMQNSNLNQDENDKNDVSKNCKLPKEDDFEEDEDLLRAKLLTSLSKNLPNLVNSSLLDVIPNYKPESSPPKIKTIIKEVPEEKRFIIQLGESDSEGEHEATKNLTKMHIKLSENIDFQQKLDSFLKSTRMQVEKSALPDVIQEPTVPKKTEKYVAKAVKHLPKPEQIEYKNLVKRMAELEKIKQSRQVVMQVQKSVLPKETLKPRNISIESLKPVGNDALDEQIAMSRKKIAEESAKMLKLKDEATKLSQKYKIVATELRNVATAITLNKKQQKIVQNGLNKIRLQHQTLLRSNTITKHRQGGNIYISLNNNNKKTIPTMKLQKENDPHKEELKNQNVIRTVKMATTDLKDEIHVPGPRLSIQVDVANNKKVVKIPKSPDKEKHTDLKRNHSETVIIEHIHSHNDLRNEASHPIVEKGGGYNDFPLFDHSIKRRKSLDDYTSPLQSLETSNWRADPNAILCPFEVGGECKDSDCKYLHTNTITP